jgi:hypothetical protein
MKKIRYVVMFGILATSSLPLGCAQDPEEGSQVLATAPAQVGGAQTAQAVSPLGHLLDPKNIFGTPKDVANGPTVKDVVTSSLSRLLTKDGVKIKEISEVKFVHDSYNPVEKWVTEYGDGRNPGESKDAHRKRIEKGQSKGHCDLHPISKANSNKRSECLAATLIAYDTCFYKVGMKRSRKRSGDLDNLSDSTKSQIMVDYKIDLNENQKWKMCFFKVFLAKFPYNIRKGPSGSGSADCTVEGHGANCDAVVKVEESGTTSTQAPASAAPASAGTNPANATSPKDPPKPAASTPTPPPRQPLPSLGETPPNFY